ICANRLGSPWVQHLNYDTWPKNPEPKKFPAQESLYLDLPYSCCTNPGSTPTRLIKVLGCSTWNTSFDRPVLTFLLAPIWNLAKAALDSTSEKLGCAKPPCSTWNTLLK